jgi:hypothetical protein
VTPLAIPADLYWRWRAAEAERRAVLLDNQRRLRTAEEAFQAACAAVAVAVPGFDVTGRYQTDDETCTATPVA